MIHSHFCHLAIEKEKHNNQFQLVKMSNLKGKPRATQTCVWHN